MSITTRGVVATKCKDVFFVIDRVTRALDKFLKTEHKAKLIKERGADAPPLKGFQAIVGLKLCEATIVTGSDAVQIHFSHNDDKRMLWVHFGCDGDNEDIAPNSLSLSMGYWGESSMYIQIALESLSMLGPVYYDQNDCDDTPYLSLPAPELTYLKACATGLEHPSIFSLKKWVRLNDSGMMLDVPVSKMIGVEPGVFKDLIQMSYEEAKSALEELILPLKAS